MFSVPMSTDTSATPGSSLHSTLDPRTQRAIGETMSVTAREPSTYHVESASGAVYIVQLPSESDDSADAVATCSCPDHANQPTESGCKHLQRVKLDIACGELLHPDDWPSDGELARREPTQPSDTSSPVAPALATDGGEAVSTTPPTSSTSIGTSPELATEEPTVTDERPKETEIDAPRVICHHISERIREIEFEIEQRRGELKDLETTLSVLEDLVPELDGSESKR